MARKRERRILVRYFACQVCGDVMPATKSKGPTHEGHVKHMWCPKCREVTEHVQTEVK